MTGSLFDPPPARGRSDSPSVLTVSALAARIDSALRTGLPTPVRVVGEVSGARQRTHWYFDLKDAGALIGCVMFASAARRTRAVIVDGQQVVATGRVEFYPPQGRLSLIVDRVEPVGRGALDEAFRRLCDQLRALGWFDESRKRPLPFLPRRVALVTSRSGAAVHDVLTTLAARCPMIEVALVDVRVQGDAAAEEIARAIRWISDHHAALGIDAVLVTRGGGSQEDLWAFNERIVAEAIVRCAVPVVAAIGHESDTTIAELVADVRASTPTQAAVRIAPDRRALVEQIDLAGRRLTSAMLRRLQEQRQRLAHARRFLARPGEAPDRARRHLQALSRHLRDASARRVGAEQLRLAGLASRLERHRPQIRLAAAQATLHQLTIRLAWAGAHLGQTAHRRVDAAAARLRAVSPQAVLDRGFAVAFAPDGSAITTPDQVRPGDRVVIRVALGRFAATVTQSPTPAPTPAGDDPPHGSGLPASAAR